MPLARWRDRACSPPGRCWPVVQGLAEAPDGTLSPEAQLLLQYLRAAHWNISAVAHQLGVARMTVYRRMKRWGIRDPHA
ncbi:MAG: hypothetical protein L6Q68_08535 [Aquabacterium sp.]|nr:hypothetical protein [Aquabacterium sp.]